MTYLGGIGPCPSKAYPPPYFSIAPLHGIMDEYACPSLRDPNITIHSYLGHWRATATALFHDIMVHILSGHSSTACLLNINNSIIIDKISPWFVTGTIQNHVMPEGWGIYYAYMLHSVVQRGRRCLLQYCYINTEVCILHHNFLSVQNFFSIGVQSIY